MPVTVEDLLKEGKKFRLVTRSDFDGLVCAAILKELKLIDEIKFVHPKDMHGAESGGQTGSRDHQGHNEF